MKITNVIFDFDGTLADSEVVNCDAISSVLIELGHTHFTPEYCLDYFLGCSVYDIRRTLKSLNEKNIERILETMHARSLVLAERSLRAMPNVHKMLDQLNTQICIASNGGRVMVTRFTEIIGVDKYFPKKNIFTRELVLNPKPAPDLYKFAALTMGENDVSKCLVIEDSVIGITAAVKAGMKVLAYHNKTDDKGIISQLLNAGALAHISDHMQILEYVS